MNFKKIISFLLIFLVLFSLFLIPSSAATVDVGTFTFGISEEFNLVQMGQKGSFSFKYFDLFNSLNSHYSETLNFSNAVTTNIFVDTRYEFQIDEGILVAGKSYELSVKNMWCGRKIVTSSSTIWSCTPDKARLILYYTDGSIDLFDCEISKYDSQDHYNVTTSFMAEKNVWYFQILMSDNFSVTCNGGNLSYTCFLGEVENCNYQISVNTIPTVPSIEEEDNSEEVGILTNILNYFKSLYNFIGDIPGYIFEYIVYLKDVLIETLSNLHDLVDGLPSRFVKVFKSYFGDIFNSIEYHIKHISTNFITKLTEIKNHISLLPEKFSNSILSLPSLIFDGIKNIFIPETATLESELKATVNNIGSQLGIHFDTYERLFDTAVAPEDVVESYYIPGLGNMQLKFLDTSYLIKGVAFFRPFIRGFFVLLLLFYNWKQALTLIDQNPAIAGSAVQGFSKGGEKGE